MRAASWATDSANDAASPKITSTSVSRVVVAASHIGAPRRRRNPVNGCTPTTRTSASRTGPMISANWRSASTLTRIPVAASTTINPRGISPRS